MWGCVRRNERTIDRDGSYEKGYENFGFTDMQVMIGRNMKIVFPGINTRPEHSSLQELLEITIYPDIGLRY